MFPQKLNKPDRLLSIRNTATMTSCFKAHNSLSCFYYEKPYTTLLQFDVLLHQNSLRLWSFLLLSFILCFLYGCKVPWEHSSTVVVSHAMSSHTECADRNEWNDWTGLLEASCIGLPSLYGHHHHWAIDFSVLKNQ